MFRPSTRRRLMAAVVVLASGTTLQLTSCAKYWQDAVISTFDFCSILNCSGSTFFDFCGSNSILLDCPNQTTTP